MINFYTFPIIKTKNLLLRNMTHKDKYDIFLMRNDPYLYYLKSSLPY